MREVFVAGVGLTPFGVHAQGLKELAVAAARAALADAGLAPGAIGQFVLSNFAAGQLTGQEAPSTVVAAALGLEGVPAYRVESACSSGGCAVRQAYLALAHGDADAVLVVGVEKMTGTPAEQITSVLSGAIDMTAAEFAAGLTFPGAFALLAERRMHEHGLTREQLSAVTSKNRRHAAANPNAHMRKPVDPAAVAASRPIAEPLRLFDCCPISDGAAALVMVSGEMAPPPGRPRVRVAGSCLAAGACTVQQLAQTMTFPAAARAAREALAAAGLTPAAVDVAEVHDCFSIAEIVACEDLGFFGPGEAAAPHPPRRTPLHPHPPGPGLGVNPRRGLLAKGHPIGATGVAQVVEIARQLRGEADNQVPGARAGLTHNVGGFGASVAVHVLTRE